MKKIPAVCVIGSLNMDLTMTTKKMPKQGETVIGEHFETYPGGKGANQAVAAARLGANVTMIGAVGTDAFGDSLLKSLSQEGINVEGISKISDVATGVASIIMSDHDNRIIVASGANAFVTPELVEQYHEQIRDSDIVLVQLETPLEAIVRTIEIANEHSIPVIVNPAPFQELPEAILTGSTFLTPNEIELEAMKQETISNSIREKIILTKGADGVQFFENGRSKDVKSYQVKVADTTGAGDTFNGALATQLGSGFPLTDAVHYANAAAALSVTKLGAQGGMPTNVEVKQFIITRQKTPS
ncbi:ribokinase [Oceanobacillus arenosus]|uniref:Ribokinase n=1 Tax=Oceanobacillus arenosus TaxID=1229153 RepID=A0A3D8PSY2_9BACI|nr:ribokinase [Oceanobacillus arenosus]RDW18105.1 ribokinase [Oceanobacillus arenosus]